MEMKSARFRPEIEGLRAVAVLSVVFFHVSEDLVPGGFAGVDVFFVISGFLITSIIMRESLAGEFSFKGFWMRRVRRLFPALAFVLACTLCAGYFILFGAQWKSLGSQTVSVLLLAGNIHMWRLANDYWGQAAQDVPLLHTWSLGVEEQFYLFFPIALVLLLKIGRRFVLPVFLVALVVSFGLSVVGTQTRPAATFYLLPTRAWELLIGCVLAVLQVRSPDLIARSKPAPLLAALGLIAMVSSFFLIEGSDAFPGFQALLPTVGAALVIAATGIRERNCVTKRFLSLPPVTYIGRISYSLYLWHWPLFVYAQWYEIGTAAIVICSLLLASFSYHLIETPFRSKTKPLRIYLTGAAALFAVTLPVHFNYVESGGLPEAIAFIDDPEASTRGWEFDAKARIAEGGIRINVEEGESPQVVLLGSSHARMFSKAFHDFAEESDLSLALLGGAKLGITEDEDPLTEKRLEVLQNWRPKAVFVAGRWEAEAENPDFEELLRASLMRIAANCDHCVVLAQVPLAQTNRRSGKNLKKYLVTDYRLTGRLPAIKEDPDYLEANRTVEAAIADLNLPNLSFLTIGGELVDGNGTIGIVAENRLLYDDHNHLNDLGSAVVFEQDIRSRLEALLNLGSGR